MKKIFTTIAFILFWKICLFGQPEIKFDTTVFDFGQIVKESKAESVFYFTNIGTEPLIITSARTSGGGLVPGYRSEKAIQPGEKDSIIFKYDSGRIGIINKSVTVESNSKLSPTIYLMVNGEVIYPKTTVKVDCKEKDIGQLKFGNVDSVQFIITNTGNGKLYIGGFQRWNYHENDILWCKIQSKNGIGNRYSGFNPGEVILITVLIRNIYGNTGEFERNLSFGDNCPFSLKIKGKFTGEPDRNVIYEGNSVFFYSEDKLVKRQVLEFNGLMIQEDFFDASYCIHVIKYDDYGEWISKSTELFYKNGVLIEEKRYR